MVRMDPTGTPGDYMYSMHGIGLLQLFSDFLSFIAEEHGTDLQGERSEKLVKTFLKKITPGTNKQGSNNHGQ